MTTNAPHDRPDRCPRCGEAFACGIARGACWCAALPPLATLPADFGADRPGAGADDPARCLCPRCLAELGGRAPEG